MTIKQISISGNQGEPSTGSLQVETISLKKRVIRAVINSVLTLVVTAVAAVIPPHIILPPIFLIAGIVITVKKFRQANVILNGSGTCPACKADVKFFKQTFRPAFNDFCESCKRDLKIKVIEQA